MAGAKGADLIKGLAETGRNIYSWLIQFVIEFEMRELKKVDAYSRIGWISKLDAYFDIFVFVILGALVW